MGIKQFYTRDETTGATGFIEDTLAALALPVVSISGLTEGQEAVSDGAGGFLAGFGLRSKGTGATNSVWAALTLYRVGDVVIAPASKLLVRCKVQHTSGSTYSSANWENYAYSAYDPLTPSRAVADLVAAMWARAHPPLYQAQPVMSFLASGFSLTTELGASFQEWAWDGTPPVRKIGIVGSSISVASTTVEGNVVNGGESGVGRNPYALEFDTDAASVFLSYRGNSTTPAYPGVGVTVDGRPVSANYLRDTGGVTNAINGFKIVFPDDRVRRIKLDLTNIDWRSIAVPAGATITAASYSPARKKIAVIGNSWIAGYVGHTADPHSIAPTLCRVLDGDYINCGIGGTGYANAGTASVYGSTARLDALQTAAPDLVIVFGAQNDDGLDVSTASAALYAAILSRLPSAKIVVVGPESTNYNTIATRATNVTDIKAAALAATNVIGGYVIDPYNGHWITGSGRIGTINGDGVADYTMVADAIHPTAFGAAYYARRIVEEIVFLALRAGKMNGFGFSVADLIA